jgi:hypothetical protein
MTLTEGDKYSDSLLQCYFVHLKSHIGMGEDVVLYSERPLITV